jgi:hypothetical protein
MPDASEEPITFETMALCLCCPRLTCEELEGRTLSGLTFAGGCGILQFPSYFVNASIVGNSIAPASFVFGNWLDDIIFLLARGTGDVYDSSGDCASSSSPTSRDVELSLFCWESTFGGDPRPGGGYYLEIQLVYPTIGNSVQLFSETLGSPGPVVFTNSLTYGAAGLLTATLTIE